MQTICNKYNGGPIFLAKWVPVAAAAAGAYCITLNPWFIAVGLSGMVGVKASILSENEIMRISRETRLLGKPEASRRLRQRQASRYALVAGAVALIGLGGMALTSRSEPSGSMVVASLVK